MLCYQKATEQIQQFCEEEEDEEEEEEEEEGVLIFLLSLLLMLAFIRPSQTDQFANPAKCLIFYSSLFFVRL